MCQDVTCVDASNELDVLAATSSSNTPELYEIIEDRTIKANIHISKWGNPGFYIGPESQEYWRFQDFLISIPPAEGVNAGQTRSYSTALDKYLVELINKGGDRGN